MVAADMSTPNSSDNFCFISAAASSSFSDFFVDECYLVVRQLQLSSATWGIVKNFSFAKATNK
jgi:hypothetical protein